MSLHKVIPPPDRTLGLSTRAIATSSTPNLKPSSEEFPTYLDNEGNFVPRHSAEHSRLMWKIDLHVLPWLAIFYFLSFLDRVNIGNARLFSLEADLNMAGSDFNIALLVFFAPYILFEIPSNLVLRKITPRIWLPCIHSPSLLIISAYVWVGNHHDCDRIHSKFTGIGRLPSLSWSI